MQTKTKTTSPAPKPDAQPVQAAFSHEDYHEARIAGSWANAAEIAEALSGDLDLHPTIRAGYLAEAARMRAKLQPSRPLGEGTVFPVPSCEQIAVRYSISDETMVVSYLFAADLERQRDALLAALEAIHEAGRMSSQPRAVYCALIAEDALEAAKGGAQ